jgi:uncharacterized surface protein with fasciclin (FAS1) repeats
MVHHHYPRIFFSSLNFICAILFHYQTKKLNKMKNLMLVSMMMIVGLTASAQKSDVVDVAISSKDHTTLVAAVKAADLVGTLERCRTLYGFCSYKCCL